MESNKGAGLGESGEGAGAGARAGREEIPHLNKQITRARAVLITSN